MTLRSCPFTPGRGRPRLPATLLPLLLVGLATGLQAPEAHAAEPFEPAGILLTWQHDPTTTMTIDWHLLPEDSAREAVLHVRERGTAPWRPAPALRKTIPHFDWLINRVELRDLDPDTEYEFHFGGDSRRYCFRTMPATLDRPIVYASAGDIHRRVDGTIAGPIDFDPDFVINPGEGPNVNGDPARVDNWYAWFEGVKRNLITDEGRVIPVLAAIGNHEVFRKRRLLLGNSPHHEHTGEEADAYMRERNLWDGKPTYFTSLFAFPGRQDATHGVLDFGDYLSVIILDSGVSTPVDGGQAGWLAAVLEERKGKMTHILPVYRYSAYPARRPYDDANRRAVRRTFVPLFEQAGVRIALESQDNNTYKRTVPLLRNERHDDGIVYIGSGIWDGAGKPEREFNGEWYVDTFHGNSHGIVGTLYPDRQEYKAIAINGDVYDAFTVTTP